MKFRNATVTLVTLAATCFAAVVTAAGSHAGGHGNDDAAIGMPGQAAKVTRTIQVDMADTMRFTPTSMVVTQGETIRFVVRNAGKLSHEFVLGSEIALKEHYDVMKKVPKMEHAEPNMVTVAPGQTGEVIWQFTRAGRVDFACLHPGHYEAGMKGLINVAGVKSLINVAGGKLSSEEDGRAHKH